jgi:hypothetical protein
LRTEFENRKYRSLEKRDLLIVVCGISGHAARKVIHMYNHPVEASENKPVSRPRCSFDPEYSSALEEIVLQSNESGKTNTVKRMLKMLEDSYHIKASYDVYLRDTQILGSKYEKSIRKNIFYDSQTIMLYRESYVSQRLAHINGKFYPNHLVFLDEPYCHVDHSTGCTWVRPRDVVNENGGKPMFVIFAAFIVFKEGHGRRAEIIQ